MQLQKLSNNSRLMEFGQGQKQDTVCKGNLSQVILDKLQFSCGIAHCREESISAFRLVIFISAGRIFISAVGNYFMKFRDFPDFFYFPKILILSRLVARQAPCLLLITKLHVASGERKILSTIKISQKIMNMVLGTLIYIH